MSESIKNSGPRRSALRTLFYPVRFILGGVRELLYGIKEVCLMLSPPLRRGRRNRQFEKAGRESKKVAQKPANVAVFRKGERERRREIIDAEREIRKFMNSNGVQASEYRESLNRRKLEYSRGESVNYLAMVNARHRQALSEDTQSPDKGSDALS